MTTELKVELEAFQGPLDLLLYLVKRDEVDILDIPIAHITQQFVRHLDVLKIIDVERAGEFLVVAAHLMEIKSKMLLPRADEGGGVEGEVEDPRRELVRQLLEYKKYKQAAEALDARMQEQSRRFGRATVAEPARSSTVGAVEVWDLVSAFSRLMRETAAEAAQAVVVDQTPLHVHMEVVLERVRATGGLKLSEVFTPPRTWPRLIGLFQAVLELARSREVVPEQPEPRGDIWLRPGDALEPGAEG
jgi:segregation and condensation protein A